MTGQSELGERDTGEGKGKSREKDIGEFGERPGKDTN